jgi:hypothetical protein
MVRSSVKSCFATFFDFEFQKNWYDPNYKHAFWDSIDYYIIDYLMPTKGFVDEAHEQIGISLYNEEEADRIQEYLRFFNDNIEGEMPDDYYVNHQDWPQVVEGAREIVAMLEENEKNMTMWQIAEIMT